MQNYIPNRLFAQSFLYRVSFEKSTNTEYMTKLISEFRSKNRDVIFDIHLNDSQTQKSVFEIFKEVGPTEKIRFTQNRSFDQNDWVYSGEGEHIGFIAPDEHTLHHITLMSIHSIGEREPVMLVYNGNEIYLPVEKIPPNILSHSINLISGEKISSDGLCSVIPVQSKMIGPKGRIITSAQTRAGLVCHAFQGELPSLNVPGNINKINFLEQWLTGSTSLTSKEFIGYEFEKDTFRIRSIEFIARVGAPDAPAQLTPRPKTMQIFGKKGTTWIPISTEFTLQPEHWQFLSPVALNFTSDEDEDFEYSGIRVDISEWYPGAHDKMELGLMRMIVRGIPKYSQNIKVPFITPPDSQMLYTQYNPYLLEYPKNIGEEIIPPNISEKKIDLTKYLPVPKKIEFANTKINYLEDLINVTELESGDVIEIRAKKATTFQIGRETPKDDHSRLLADRCLLLAGYKFSLGGSSYFTVYGKVQRNTTIRLTFDAKEKVFVIEK